MKKIIYLLTTITGLLLWASCSQKVTPTPKSPASDEDMGRKKVPGVRGVIVLRPVDNTAKSGSKNYPFFYDGINETLDFTDNETEYVIARTSVPEYIDVDSIGKGFEMQSMSAYPFVNFTEEAKKEIANKSGVQFSNINAYRISYTSNMQILSNSRECMEILLNMLLQKKNVAPSTSDLRTAVNGDIGMLTMHPIKNIIKDMNGHEWYVFYDYVNQCIYITDDPAMYEKFSTALPLRVNLEKPQNAVLVQGISINPFTYFDQTTLEAMSKEKGLEINGKNDSTDAKNDLGLNGWIVLKISNDAVVFDYKKVVEVLTQQLGITNSTPSLTHTPRAIGDTSHIIIPPFPSSPTRQRQPSSNQVTHPSGNGRGVYDAGHH